MKLELDSIETAMKTVTKSAVSFGLPKMDNIKCHNTLKLKPKLL